MSLENTTPLEVSGIILGVCYLDYDQVNNFNFHLSSGRSSSHCSTESNELDLMITNIYEKNKNIICLRIPFITVSKELTGKLIFLFESVIQEVLTIISNTQSKQFEIPVPIACLGINSYNLAQSCVKLNNRPKFILLQCNHPHFFVLLHRDAEQANTSNKRQKIRNTQTHALEYCVKTLHTFEYIVQKIESEKKSTNC